MRNNEDWWHSVTSKINTILHADAFMSFEKWVLSRIALEYERHDKNHRASGKTKCMYRLYVQGISYWSVTLKCNILNGSEG